MVGIFGDADGADGRTWDKGEADGQRGGADGWTSGWADERTSG